MQGPSLPDRWLPRLCLNPPMTSLSRVPQPPSIRMCFFPYAADVCSPQQLHLYLQEPRTRVMLTSCFISALRRGKTSTSDQGLGFSTGGFLAKLFVVLHGAVAAQEPSCCKPARFPISSIAFTNPPPNVSSWGVLPAPPSPTPIRSHVNAIQCAVGTQPLFDSAV